jgi:hypothetical protein
MTPVFISGTGSRYLIPFSVFLLVVSELNSEVTQTADALHRYKVAG